MQQTNIFPVMAGGAITSKSNPEEEYEECIVVKAILDNGFKSKSNRAI